ncbi:hypothetical protein NKR23_g7368 [Pleurostoma richardsiae]|uniref:Uncharacterized protein n=1 Tax=Pleurostoma richardsiae TaxID=41990 RepID=A0AA38RLP5_9PEZI|nr:hypothetical protein NKR23_g7368 [Pleurostoma richardsiae]
MAVCVEETPCGQGVKVLIAVNTLAPESGHVVLRLVQNSFNRIFQILQRFRSDSYNNIENDVFEEIINLCQKRILNRMRSKKSPVRHDKKAECYLGELFGDFVDALRRQGNRDLAFQMHIDEAQSVLDILEEFEHDSNPQDTLEKRVANVVQKIQHFMEDVNLGRLLETAKGISQESRSTILDSMRKIARYREAARFLYRRAKKYPILQNAHATQVRLDASVFPQSPEGYLPDLTSAIVRFEEQGCHVSNAIAVKRLRKKPAAKNRQFSDKVFEGVKHAKIHAEIQILAHYELHPVQRPPRYIASNMDACYLCWTFIRLHGKFHVRKSHGSLHTRWKLPVVATLRPVQEQLNAALEEDIIHGIKQPVLAKSRGFVQKSTVFSVILSATTLSGSGIAGSDPVTVGRSEKVVTIEERVPETSNDKSAEDVLPHDIPTQDSEVEDLSPDSDLDMTGHSAVNDDTRGSLASPDSEASLSSLASLSSEESVDSTSGTQSLQALHVRLIQGQKVSYNLRDLGENSSFSTPLLRVIPEFNLTSKNPGASDREEWWIEWLSDRAARYVRRYGSEQIIDVLSLSTATDMSLRNRDSVYLTHGGDIVQMRTLGVVL